MMMNALIQQIASGIATGAVYAVRLLRRLREAGRETHLIASAAGVLSVHHELGLDRRALEQLADVAYAPGDVGAAVASGSFAIEAMVVAPCSMKSLAAIALGMGDNLLILAFVVIVIGGIGSVRGAFLAALIVGLVLLTVNFLIHRIFGWMVHDGLQGFVSTLPLVPQLLLCVQPAKPLLSCVVSEPLQL